MNTMPHKMGKTILAFGTVFLLATSNVFANGSAEKVRITDVDKIVGYDKGLYIQTPDEKFKLKVNMQLQPQYQFLSIEGVDKNHTFQIRRGRLVFSGHAFDKDLTYKFQLEAVSGRVNTTQEGTAMTGPNLREAFINYKVNDHLELRGGQFKPFFNREEMTSSTALQFVDRSILNDVFSHGYDLGIGIHGGFFDKRLEYGVYAANENNNRNTFNFNNEFLFGGRVACNILGQHGYTMSDVNESDQPHLVVGVAASTNKPQRGGGNGVIAATGDVAYRYKGLSLYGEGSLGRNTTTQANVYGFLGQAGYFIVPKKFEVAARVAAVIPTTAGAPDGYEYGGSLNYFFKGHNVKLQLDYGLLQNSPLVFNGASNAVSFVNTGAGPLGFIANQTDHRIRTQMQLYF